MTGPDVLISGGEHEPRRLPPWLRCTAAGVVVVGLLVAVLVRLAADERSRERLELAADAVDVRTGISDVALGVDGSVVVAVQVTGTGAEVRVDTPALVPLGVASAEAVGVPLRVSTAQGNAIRLRLRPDCAQVLDLPRVDLELPVTPASGKRHVVRVAVTSGPDMLRRACGYLPPDEALFAALADPRVAGDTLRVDVLLRNDGHRPLTVSGARSPGLAVLGPTAPATLPEAGTATLPLQLRVSECRRTGPLLLVATDPDGVTGEVSLPYEGAAGVTLGALRERACG